MHTLVLTAPYEFHFQENPIPQPGTGEVLLQTRANGICGSDLHFYHGTHPYRAYPMQLGHEAAARVIDVGEGVDDFRKGDTVVVQPLVSCGTCYPCRQGRTNCCSRMKTVGVNIPGALAEYYTVPAYCCFKIPAAFPPALASLVEPFSIGFQAVARGQINPADRIAILGAGPIGLTALAAAQERGAKVAITDLLDARLQLAANMGADLTINSKEQNAADLLREWTDGDMPSVVIEAVGSPRTIESAIQLVADAGRVVVVGVTEQQAQIRGVDLTRKELTLYGSRNNLGLFQTAIEYVMRHRDITEAMVTHQFPFERTIEAFQLADAHPDQVCKVVITMNT